MTDENYEKLAEIISNLGFCACGGPIVWLGLFIIGPIIESLKNHFDNLKD